MKCTVIIQDPNHFGENFVVERSMFIALVIQISISRKILWVAGSMSKRKVHMLYGTSFLVFFSEVMSESSVQQHHVCSHRCTGAVALVNQAGSSRALWMAARGTLTDVL